MGCIDDQHLNVGSSIPYLRKVLGGVWNSAFLSIKMESIPLD
jgi:hypothetical protein